MFQSRFQGGKKSALFITGTLILAIALIDWRASNELPLWLSLSIPHADRGQSSKALANWRSCRIVYFSGGEIR